MNEEEKKAIENLKGTYWYVGEEGLEENIKIVLNLIEKQQKEIEQEKEKNKKLYKKIDELQEENIHWKGQYHLLSRKIDVTSNEKIREKIEEIDNNGLNICNEQLNYQMKLQDEAKISILQELLEERK